MSQFTMTPILQVLKLLPESWKYPSIRLESTEKPPSTTMKTQMCTIELTYSKGTNSDTNPTSGTKTITRILKISLHKQELLTKLSLEQWKIWCIALTCSKRTNRCLLWHQSFLILNYYQNQENTPSTRLESINKPNTRITKQEIHIALTCIKRTIIYFYYDINPSSDIKLQPKSRK